jgi:hypothetical protein
VLDGHESHCNLPFIDYAWKHRILVFVLPAHSSHLTQPLDVGLFGPLQHYYSKMIREMFKGDSPTLLKEDFIPILRTVREYAYSPHNIKSAWKATGLVPYNERKVLNRLEVPKTEKVAVDARRKEIQTPKKPQDFRQLKLLADQLVPQGEYRETLLDAIEKIAKGAVEGATMGAIAMHEAKTLRQRLVFKAHHKTSKARLIDKHQGRSKLMTQERIDQLKKELEEKEKEAAEKEARARAKKAAKGKGKAAVPKHKKTRSHSIVSSDASDCIALDPIGNCILQTIFTKLTLRSKIRFCGNRYHR